MTLSGLAAVGHQEECDSASGLVLLDMLHERADIGVRFSDDIVNFPVPGFLEVVSPGFVVLVVVPGECSSSPRTRYPRCAASVVGLIGLVVPLPSNLLHLEVDPTP